MYAVISVLLLVVFVGALVDIITRPSDAVKHLPKLVWVFIVIFLPFVGSVLWFAIGREYAAPHDRGSFGDPRRHEALSAERMSRATPSAMSTEEQLAALDREIEHHENLARIARLEAEIQKRRGITPGTDR
ncbi:PLD nuclease N-terminal domain-containing protein [Glaciihabitans sp. dw_435]|uniref:PLD nuclease N-terminal domain-containing protein n=1 Tax=Glaciihabitans sp. dw_435 TaxID=2720081 RepID=UPI001BD58F33|nr:PLD nuclease N-terminal domain-containing protein [Glaciihabitans sp. dw_435]